MNLFPDASPAPSILVVDDAPEHILVLQDILTGAGCRVRTADSGWEGLQMALAEPPDLILLDQLMPNMDGMAVLKALLADPRTMNVPVLFLTLLGGTEEVAKGLDAGARDYLQKPFHARELLARVRAHLGWKRSRDREQALLKELYAARAELQELRTASPLALPARAAALGAKPTTRPLAQAPARILLVAEDHPTLRSLIAMLRTEYKLLVATTPAEALATADREAPELILLDGAMADRAGHELCRQFQQAPLTRTIPILFMTGPGRGEEEPTGLSLGAQDVLDKPFSLPVVLRRVRTSLDLKRFRDL